MGLPHSRPSHQELAARPWQFSELSGCGACSGCCIPFAGEPPLGNQATPEDPPTSALPHSPPEWSLGGMTGRNCSRASPSQPQEPTSSSTLLISFCPPGKGAKKPGTWDPGQCLSTHCETFWGGIVRRQIRFRRTGLPVSVHRYQVLLLGRSPLGMTVHIIVFGICHKSLEAQCSAQNLPKNLLLTRTILAGSSINNC